MDNNGLDTLRQGAADAATSASNMATDAPTLLNTLKQNLVGIFSDNNPVVGARNNALSDYLAEGANSRAAMLPSNVGDVPGYAGRPLTLSPTQQDAITTSRNAAAYAPLNGYNAILQSMFGQIPDMVKNAGDIYGATINSANDRAKIAQQQFEDSLKQYEAEKKAGASNGLLDDPRIQAILQAILGGNTNNPTPTTTRPPLDSFFQPTQNQPTTKVTVSPKPTANTNSAQLKQDLTVPQKSSTIGPLGVHVGGTFLPFAL